MSGRHWRFHQRLACYFMGFGLPRTPHRGLDEHMKQGKRCFSGLTCLSLQTFTGRLIFYILSCKFEIAAQLLLCCSEEWEKRHWPSWGSVVKRSYRRPCNDFKIDNIFNWDFDWLNIFDGFRWMIKLNKLVICSQIHKFIIETF